LFFGLARGGNFRYRTFKTLDQTKIRFPWSGADSPHFVLELTDRCNISCRGCYKKTDGGIRPMERIFEDIDQALARRRIDTVSLAGAEPALHPGLCEIVRHLRRRKVRVALITNGLALDDDLLADLAASGLDVVMLHVDEGQSRPDLDDPENPESVEALRAKLVRRVAARGIGAGVSVTIYPEFFDRLPGLIDWIVRTEEIGFAFVTHYISPTELRANRGGKTTNGEVVRVLRESFGFEPFAGLRGGMAWISYFIPVLYRNGHADPVRIRPGWGDALMVRLPRFLRGRHMYYSPPSAVATAVQVLANSLFQFRFVPAFRFLSKLPGGRLVAKRIVFDDGSGGCGEHCPNPTLRGGEFVPVCKADLPSEPERA
jgi:pyruvate-formate lyase-activating enzyme